MATKNTLTSDDWIKAAFRALTAGGVQAVRAEAIARDLKVSKGSFYWHFKDVPDLKAKMLAHWAREATDTIINEVEASQRPAEEQLRLLVCAATDDRNLPYGGLLADSAVREWARFDTSAAETLKAVDQRRIDYVADLLGRCGFSARHSRSGANGLYGALIGLEALAASGLADLRADLLGLLEALLHSRDAT
ncbi:MAG TPA: TetR/AcrR family transcriptional regulator [Ensifer sp.]|jgi:AcrR family transcriptional regulator|uniref:TetR/AcrR family transcriptional regulator n=1 Tax=Ensifer sp. TaxID=1872086 RepID=UPI002E0F8E7F|nr:TetR/AcrR family transcriptional regulator [Ensifer sp.]